MKFNKSTVEFKEDINKYMANNVTVEYNILSDEQYLRLEQDIQDIILDALND